MLANDPHLDLKTPLFWYWMSFKTPDFNIIGGSLPGVPVIISGTNGNVAWGLTNAYINTADAVFLKDYPKDYFVSFRPKVDVKLGFLKLPFIFKSFEKTKDGDPVLPLELDNKTKMVLRWTGFKMKSHHLVPMFNLMKAKNVTQMDDALKEVGVPAWNFVFADQKGDIGYRVVGEAFRDHKIDEYGISTETPEEFRKKELLHPMERPHVLKPKRNYIYSANNRHWPKDSKFYGGRGYTLSFRGYRIDELLKLGMHDLDSFKRIQCDRQAVDAQFFVPKILKWVNIPEFKTWNYDTSNDSMAPSLYRRLMDLLMEGWQVNEHALFKLLDHPTETQIKELYSFSTVARNQISGRSWGQVHKLTFAHLSKNEDWKFSPEIEGIGDNHSVDPGTSKWDPDKKNYEQFSGASMRMIILMKPIPEIYLSLPGYNRNYTEYQSNIPSWKEWKVCEYNQVKF
jgi:acyl-homoserine lactone acylase PvdQ